MLTVQRNELLFVLESLYTFDAELEQLEKDTDWFVSDSRERLEASKQILQDILGIQDYEHDEEVEHDSLELHFD